MTHVVFDPDQVNWSPFLQVQVGSGEKYFIGTRWQRGSGFLSSVARFLVPLAKNIATSAGHEGIAAGTRVLGDIAQGRDLKESIAEHGRASLQNLGKRLEMCGKGKKKKSYAKPKRAIKDQLSLI